VPLAHKKALSSFSSQVVPLSQVTPTPSAAYGCKMLKTLDMKCMLDRHFPPLGDSVER
jgi:hypothetical protein